MISEAYVFIDGLEERPIICGLFRLDSRQRKGTFVYGQSYLKHPKAFALDPLRLPLTEQSLSNTLNHGVFGVLADAGPDAWGKKLILGLHGTKPANDLEYLLAGSGYGVGMLNFSLSRTTTKRKQNRNSIGDLGQLTRKVAEADAAGSYSYGQLAEFIRYKTATPEKAEELFRCMVFNVFIGNTDDHSRNHAMLYSLADARWRLSPAYDITPVNSSRIHGIGIGALGRSGTIENLSSQASRFGLNSAKAEKIIEQTREYSRQWPLLFKQFAAVSDTDLERLKGIIPGISQ